MGIPQSYLAFLADERAVREFGDYWVEAYITDPAGAPLTLFYSRRGTPSPATDTTLLLGSGGDLGTDVIFGNTLYKKRLLSAPTIQHSIWQGERIGGRSIPAYGNISLQNADGGLDGYHPGFGYVWADARIKVFFFDQRNPQGTVGKIFDGKVADIGFKFQTVDITVVGHESDFEKPSGSWVYRGTGYCLEISQPASAGEELISWGVANVGPQCTTALTYERWVWFEAFGTGSTFYDGWIPATGNYPWRINYSGSTGLINVTGTASAGVAGGATSAYPMDLRTWYHVAVTISGRDVTIVIWNDAFQTETIETFTNAFASATRDAVTNSFYRTGRAASTGVAAAAWWNDEYRVYNAVRTIDDIRNYRHAPMQTPYPASLQHYIKYDDGSGSTIISAGALTLTNAISGPGSFTWLRSCEGDEALAGTPKPEVWGTVERVKPVLVDAVAQVYQVAHGGDNAMSYPSGSIKSIAPNEGGIAHSTSTAAGLRAFITTTPAAGTALLFPSLGLFKLGTIPSLPISAKVEGYYYGGPPGINTLDQIMRRVLYRGGYGSGNLVTADFTTLANDTIGGSALCGMQVSDPSSTPLSALMDMLAQSWFGWWGNKRGTNLLSVAIWDGAPNGTPDLVLDNSNIVSIEPLEVQQAVVYQVIVRFRKNYVPLGDGEIAQSIVNTAAAQELRTEWQEEKATDWTLRAKYPGNSSSSVIIETCLHDRYYAQLLAQRALAVLKGAHYGFTVVVKAPGKDLTIDNLVSINVTSMKKKTRYGLNGTFNFATVTVNDKRQGGTVQLVAWR